MAAAAKLFSHLKTNWAWFVTTLIALTAFSLRYWFFWRYPYPLMIHEQDGIAYMLNARDLLSFKPPGNIFMPPFYSLVIALFSLLPVKLESAARLASITMDSLVIFPLFGLARIFLPRGAALSVCGLWAAFAFSLFYTPSPLSQSTYLCMLLAGTYLLYLAIKARSGLWLYGIAGACLSAAYQTRPEGIVALGGGLALLAISLWGSGADRRRQLKGAAIFSLSWAICALPYILLLHATLGHWTFTAKTTVAIKGIDGSLTLGSAGTATKSGVDLWLEQFGGLSGGIDFIQANLTAFFDLLLRSFPSWTHPLAFIGLLFMFASRIILPRLFLLIPLLVTVPVYLANLPKVHAYIYPLFPFYLLALVGGFWMLLALAGKGINLLHPSLPATISSLLLQLLLVIALIPMAVSSWRDANSNFSAPDYLYQVYLTDRIFKSAGEDLKIVSSSGETVMTRWGLISYFAQRPLMIMPKGNIDQVLAHGRKNGAKLVVIDTESVGTRRQELVELLNPLYGQGIDPRHRLQTVAVRASDVGGYVIYRYL